MGIYFDFRKRLLMEFESVAGRRVELSELVFGERRAAPTGSGYDSLIEVTWGEITRGFVYNRTPLDKVLMNLDKAPATIDFSDGLPSAERFVRGILDTYGIELDAQYFNFNTPPVGRGSTVVTALPNNPIYVGTAYVMTRTTLPPGVYRQPDHEWLLDGSTADTGTMSMPLPGDWDTQTIGGELFMRPKTHVNFGASFGMRVDGDFTLDFELSFALGSGYAYLFGVPSLTSRGALTFYNGKLYHYLITPSSIDPNNEWYKKMPVSDGTPIRYTLVSIGGKEHWYINGQYLDYSHDALPESGTYLLQYLQSGAWLRNVRYWKAGLFNPELNSLFNKAVDSTLLPDHWFPLNGNGYNKGLNSNWFPGNVAYPLLNNETWCQPTASGANMGVTIDLSQPFTLQLDLVNPTGVFGAADGLFSDISTNASGGALRFHNGNLMFVTGAALFNTSAIFADKQPHRLTLQGDGTNFYAWVDDKFVGAVTVGTKTTLAIIGFAGTTLTTNWYLRDLKIWSRKVPIEQLRQFSDLPKLDLWQSVVGLTALGSNVQMADGNFNTFFNATYDPTVTGSFGDASKGKFLMAMYYYFVIDSVNWRKKIPTFYIDVIENGVWVNKAIGRTNYVSMSFPGRDIVILDKPVFINPADPRVRIRGIGTWGDPYNYRWCTELVFLTSSLA